MLAEHVNMCLSKGRYSRDRSHKRVFLLLARFGHELRVSQAKHASKWDPWDGTATSFSSSHVSPTLHGRFPWTVKFGNLPTHYGSIACRHFSGVPSSSRRLSPILYRKLGPLNANLRGHHSNSIEHHHENVHAVRRWLDHQPKYIHLHVTNILKSLSQWDKGLNAYDGCVNKWGNIHLPIESNPTSVYPQFIECPL